MTRPVPSARALQLHAAACEAGQAGYIDPDSGLMVMTSVGLANRLSCCGNGCRHCPWPTDAQRRAKRATEAPSWPWPGARPRGYGS